MNIYLTRGSLGDSYIIMLKLRNIRKRIIINHHTKHRYWWPTIRDIHSFNNHVTVRFSDEPRLDLPEVTSDSHEGEMDFFPDLGMENVYVEQPYIAIQPHSGKPQGFNRKDLPMTLIKQAIYDYGYKCVFIGTDRDAYGGLGQTCGTNLVGRTTVLEAMSIVANAEKFVGPEGFLSFVALSHKVDSDIYYKSRDAVRKRIENTPWEEYAWLLPMR